MIKVLFGKKGTGKTKTVIDEANALALKSEGDVVFIDDSDHLTCELNRRIRFINIKEYPIDCGKGFLGFVSGILSEDYDVDTIFIDGLNYILKEDDLEPLFQGLGKIDEKFKVNFFITMNGEPTQIPEYLKEFVI